MDETAFQPPPKALEAIMAETRAIGFQNWCWPPVGALLRIMAALKPGGRLLEIGTGTGVGTCWLLDGMDASARLLTVDINPGVQTVAREHLWNGPKADDAHRGLRRELPNSLDLIFADGGIGKHIMLDETLALLRPGGIYICDDMKPHPMWPPEHARKIPPLVEALGAQQGFRRIYIDWSSGVAVMVKLAE